MGSRQAYRGNILKVLVLSCLLFVIPAISSVSGARGSQEQESERREFSVSAHKYAFDPVLIQVRQGDLVKISLHAADIPHSFTVDAYRIAKRAAAGQTVVFEFRADQAGKFPFYCNLTLDERCREMRGELVVLPR